MAPTWIDDMATGIAELDDDHRRIATVFDDVFHCLDEERGHDQLVTALSALVDALCEHIEREDELMRSISYPAAEPHRIEHNNYLCRLSQLLVDCQKHNRCIADKVHALFRLWRSEHQQLFDRPLARAVLELQESQPTVRPEFSHPSAYR